MKTLKHIILTAAIVIIGSIAAFAQDQDRKPRPPKENPPAIVPGKKPDDKPKENRPKDDERGKENRGKRPQMFLSKIADTYEIRFM